MLLGGSHYLGVLRDEEIRIFCDEFDSAIRKGSKMWVYLLSNFNRIQHCYDIEVCMFVCFVAFKTSQSTTMVMALVYLRFETVATFIIYPSNCPVHFAFLKALNVFPYSMF